ncbi:MAG: glycerophosphodiester phosphodiesterase [Rhizobiaceae bacterium]|nr:glycerophosphodiester phosphodiesterase [Rhizobiaceae bacterium]
MRTLNPAPGWITQRPIAHRGFHDLAAGRPENSLAAVVAAAETGFAVECDLQVSATGEAVVFHDPGLERMTGTKGNVRDFSPHELAQLHLVDTDQVIDTLSTHLDRINGRVPMVLELKGVEGADAGFVEAVATALQNYPGLVCVMSFNHWICAQFAQLMPDIPRGLTAENGDEVYQKHFDAMYAFDLQFVSYKVQHVDNRFVREMKQLGLPIITWTVKNQESRSRTFKFADQMTFEGFDPRDLPHG